MANLLVWDRDEDRNIESGVSNVILFPMGVSTWGDGVAWNGVTAINENPSGADVTDLFADDMKYASLRGSENFGCTIEAFTYPDEWNQCDGSATVSGVPGVYFGQQTRKAFCLAYKTKIGDASHPSMDKGYKWHLIYNCTASPSSRGYSTINDNPDAISFSWEANSNGSPCTSLTKNVCCLVVDSTKCTIAGLGLLEAKLYGTAASGGAAAVPSAMPTPDWIVTNLAGTRNNTRSLDDDDR